MITQSSNHLLSIITDIVDISNIEANLVKVTNEELNVNSILKTIYYQQIQKAQDKKIDLIFDGGISDTEAGIISDKTKLLQILTNLVNNAIKFTSKGSVKVSCRLKCGMLEFLVADTGIGIPLEQQTKIFDRFYQVQYAVSRTYEGTGLGLAISKAYAELLGGTLMVTSQPDKGSTFSFSIPYDAKKKKVNAEPIPSVSNFEYQIRKKILVAEDNESSFKLIKYFLKDVNAEIIRALNGKEAVDYCMSDNKIDLILMDLRMPVMDGYEAVKILRDNKIEVPIIAQTAYAIDKENAIEAGCSDFISKPFDKFGLLRKISEYI